MKRYIASILGALVALSVSCVADASVVSARQKFFGAENVDAGTGAVKKNMVLFTWITNASIAVALEGRVILLDTYINRLELPSDGKVSDLRRTPIDIQDLIDLNPEAIFLGHGHGDHADNAAYIAKKLNIPVYSTPETCDALQADVLRMFNDPNLVNGGAKIVADALPINCIAVVSRGSVPGVEVRHLAQLEPLACVIAFKHIHSGSVPTDLSFPFVPVNNIPDQREPDLYPVQPCLAPRDPRNSEGCSGSSPLSAKPLPGQIDLTSTVGTGGPISIYYEFVLRGGYNFSFAWHNTTGPLKEGVGSDPGLPNPSVGANLFRIMDTLPQTDVELGSIVSSGLATNGVRDAVMYQQHIKPQVYIPLHMTNVAVPSSSLEFKKSYLQTLDSEQATVRPELRWMVDPDDYLRPMAYNPLDPRWSNPGKASRIGQFCN